MSGLCIVNLKQHNLAFKELNQLAKRIMRFALSRNLATFFNAYDYRNDIIKSAKMHDFFLMSDNWLYKNCDFLDSNFDYEKLGYGWESPKIKQNFIERFKFFDEILNIIFHYEISLVEVYISDTGGVDTAEDFDIVQTSTQNFLNDLYMTIINYSNKYAYGFPNIKFEISKS